MLMRVDIIESVVSYYYIRNVPISEPTAAQVASEQKSEAIVEGSAVLISTAALSPAGASSSTTLPQRGGVAYRDTDLDMLYKMIQDTPTVGSSTPTVGSSAAGGSRNPTADSTGATGATYRRAFIEDWGEEYGDEDYAGDYAGDYVGVFPPQRPRESLDEMVRGIDGSCADILEETAQVREETAQLNNEVAQLRDQVSGLRAEITAMATNIAALTALLSSLPPMTK